MVSNDCLHLALMISAPNCILLHSVLEGATSAPPTATAPPASTARTWPGHGCLTGAQTSSAQAGAAGTERGRGSKGRKQLPREGKKMEMGPARDFRYPSLQLRLFDPSHVPFRSMTLWSDMSMPKTNVVDKHSSLKFQATTGFFLVQRPI